MKSQDYPTSLLAKMLQLAKKSFLYNNRTIFITEIAETDDVFIVCVSQNSGSNIIVNQIEKDVDDFIAILVPVEMERKVIHQANKPMQAVVKKPDALDIAQPIQDILTDKLNKIKNGNFDEKDRVEVRAVREITATAIQIASMELRIRLSNVK